MTNARHLPRRAASAALALATAGLPMLAMAQEAAPPASAVSSGSPGAVVRSIGSSLGSMFKGLTGAGAPAAETAPATGGAAPANGSSLAPAPGDAISGSAASSSGLQIVDIDKWSGTASVVLDPLCKTLVQPFDITDNAASLAVLGAKLKTYEVLARLPGQAGTAQQNSRDAIQQSARSLNWLPMSAEKALGESMLADAELVEEGKNKDSKRLYADARAMLQDIVKQLPQQPIPYEFQVKVRTTSFGNATALPGGILLVDRDLFKKGANPDFAWFVMAHEVSHVLQRHETRVYQARLIDGVDTIDGVRKVWQGASAAQAGTMVGYATKLKKTFVNFSEDQELQADSCAMRLMVKRFPNPKDMAGKVQAIEDALGPVTPVKIEGPDSPAIADQLKYLGDGVLERHPNSARRRANLQAALKAASAAP